MTTRRSLLAVALGCAAASRHAWAQPATTTLWSGFPSGGLGDQVTRPLIERLKGIYPSTIVYDAKPGAGGRIAVDFVKRAVPDGATLLQVPSSPITLYPHTYGKKLTYDALVDFVPVTPLAAYALSVTVGPGAPADVKSV